MHIRYAWLNQCLQLCTLKFKSLNIYQPNNGLCVCVCVTVSVYNRDTVCPRGVPVPCRLDSTLPRMTHTLG